MVKFAAKFLIQVIHQQQRKIFMADIGDHAFFKGMGKGP